MSDLKSIVKIILGWFGEGVMWADWYQIDGWNQFMCVTDLTPSIKVSWSYIHLVRVHFGSEVG